MKNHREAFLIVVALLFTGFPLQAGVIKGQVLYKGSMPTPETTQITKDTMICGKSKTRFQAEVDKNGGVKEAVVRILGIKSQGTPSGPAPVLSQTHCDFTPTVVIVPPGASLILTNDDTILHNTHAYREDGSTVFNIAIPVKGMKIPWKPSESGILQFKCDAGHNWMESWAVILENSYYAQTASDGSFTIANAPQGEFEIEAWHPFLGKITQRTKVGGSAVTVSLVLPGK